MSLRSGLHAITNRKTGSALTVSDGPNPKTITGSEYDGTQNQKWDLVDLGGDIWEIRAIGSGDFVGVLGGLLPGSGIFAVPAATELRITQAHEYGLNHYHISLPDTDLRVSMANDGSLAPDTPVRLAPSSEDVESHVWEFRHLSV